MKKKLNVDLIPAIKKLNIVNKRISSGKNAGEYRSAFKGKGLDFDGYRTYAPDDDANLIDWKATVRSGEVLVRSYIEERDIIVFFLLDVGDSMVFGSTPKLKNEYSAELIASLSYAILEEGDSVGIALFNDKPVYKIYQGRGKEQFYNLTRGLLNPENYGGKFDFCSACKFLLNYLKQDSIVIFVSDFINLNGGWIEHLGLLSKKFDVIGIMARDPRDRELPKENSQIAIEDPHSKKSLIIESNLIREAYSDYIKKQEKEIREQFLKSGADFINVSTDKSFAGPIMNLFKQRGLKWR